MLPIITKGEARGDYRSIPKVSIQLRLWFPAFNFSYEIGFFDEVSNRF